MFIWTLPVAIKNNRDEARCPAPSNQGTTGVVFRRLLHSMLIGSKLRRRHPHENAHSRGAGRTISTFFGHRTPHTAQHRAPHSPVVAGATTDLTDRFKIDAKERFSLTDQRAV